MSLKLITPGFSYNKHVNNLPKITPTYLVFEHLFFPPRKYMHCATLSSSTHVVQTNPLQNITQTDKEVNIYGKDTACLEVTVPWETWNVNARESTYV